MRILDAAAAVFARKGFHQATIRDIAEQADVADGTIYNYYANKRALFLAVTRHVVADSAADVLAEHDSDGDRDFLAAILGERFHSVQRNADFVRAVLAEVWTDEDFRQQYFGEVIAPLLDQMEGYLGARIEAGTMRAVNTGVVIRAMAGSFLIFLLLSRPGHGGFGLTDSAEDIVEALVDFFLNGLQVRSAEEAKS
jgi:AcrR family transcriptional regulator